jgi:hypothetical protein
MKRVVIYGAIVFSFAYGVMFELPWNIGATDIIDGVCRTVDVWPNNVTKRATGVYVFMMCYLLPVLTMTFCYGRIYYVLQTKVSNLRDPGRYFPQTLKLNVY